MVAACSYKTLANAYQTARLYVPEKLIFLSEI
jgi:hypothetical protein